MRFHLLTLNSPLLPPQMLASHLLKAKPHLGLRSNRTVAPSAPKCLTKGVDTAVKNRAARSLLASYHTSLQLSSTTAVKTHNVPITSKNLGGQITESIRATRHKRPSSPSERSQLEQSITDACKSGNYRQLEAIWKGHTVDQASPRALSMTLNFMSRFAPTSSIPSQVASHLESNLEKYSARDLGYLAQALMHYYALQQDISKGDALIDRMFALNTLSGPLASVYASLIRHSNDPLFIDARLQRIIQTFPDTLNHDRFVSAFIYAHLVPIDVQPTDASKTAIKTALATLEAQNANMDVECLTQLAKAFKHGHITMEDLELWHQRINKDFNLQGIAYIVNGLKNQAHYADALKWFQRAKSLSVPRGDHLELYLNAVDIYAILNKPHDWLLTFEEAWALSSTPLRHQFFHEALRSGSTLRSQVLSYINAHLDGLSTPSPKPYLNTLSEQQRASLVLPPAPVTASDLGIKINLQKLRFWMVPLLWNQTVLDRSWNACRLILDYMIKFNSEFEKMPIQRMLKFIKTALASDPSHEERLKILDPFLELPGSSSAAERTEALKALQAIVSKL